MILLDTHVWVWWAQADERLSQVQVEALDRISESGIGVSAISCWEIANLYAAGRLEFDRTLDDWFDDALAYPGVRLVELSRGILVESCRLPGEFHRDPADRILVATARAHSCPLVMFDRKILEYEHVELITPSALAEM